MTWYAHHRTRSLIRVPAAALTDQPFPVVANGPSVEVSAFADKFPRTPLEFTPHVPRANPWLPMLLGRQSPNPSGWPLPFAQVQTVYGAAWAGVELSAPLARKAAAATPSARRGRCRRRGAGLVSACLGRRSCRAIPPHPRLPIGFDATGHRRGLRGAGSLDGPSCAGQSGSPLFSARGAVSDREAIMGTYLVRLDGRGREDERARRRRAPVCHIGDPDGVVQPSPFFSGLSQGP